MDNNLYTEIGKGLFTTAYKHKRKNEVTLVSNDPVKECMAHGWFPNSHLFPRINFKGNDLGLYTMRYYKKQPSLKKALKPTHYALYKELRDMYLTTLHSWDSTVNVQGLNNVINMFKTLDNKRVARILIEAAEACGNYGNSVTFEISPRNVAVSDTGGLILLDCFFMGDKAKEIMNNV